MIEALKSESDGLRCPRGGGKMRTQIRKICLTAAIVVIVLSIAAAISFLSVISPAKDKVEFFHYPPEFFCACAGNRIDYQTEGKYAAYAAAYLLRYFGEDAHYNRVLKTEGFEANRSLCTAVRKREFMMIILLLLLITFFFAAFILNASMFRPEKQLEANIDGRRVTFPSGRNRLAGYLWNEAGMRGLLVFVHGMGTGVEYYLPEIHHFAAQGYKVFAFEYSGYQGSSGHFYGFPQAVIDLKNALGFIDDGSLPVILMGHSMGAYAVCAVRQCTDKPVNVIVAYAPFSSSDEAVIAEATGNMPKCGKLLCSLILPMQRILFGTNCNPTAVAGLSRANVPTLVLQGSEDVEVSPNGCALYAHRSELSDYPVMFRLVREKESNGHMTVIRKKGSHDVNSDTMQLVEIFLGEALHQEK